MSTPRSPELRPQRLGRPLRTVCAGWAAALAAAAAGAAVPAAPPAADLAELGRLRAEIQAERQRLTLQFDAEQAGCRHRFAVTSCLDDVRERRRLALEGPRQRELALDDAERQARARARREAVAEKQRRGTAASEPAAAASAAP